jgi:hypothetical protein
MTKYNVYLHREVRLTIADIEADSPEAAATIARDTSTGFADRIDDCEDLAALVDLAEDQDFRQSVTIDFEPERIRKAATALLAALESLADQADEDCPRDCRSRHFTEALQEAREAVATAKTAGIPSASAPANPPARFEIEHNPTENSDRVYVLVDGKFDVAIIRTDEGVVVDIYPKEEFEAVASTYAFDTDVEPEQDAAKEAGQP